MIIAIDGYTGTGKGTTAMGVAKILGYTYLDTGAMYRCATLYAQRNNLLQASDEEKANILDKITITFKQLNGTQKTFLNNELIENDIRSSDLGLIMKPIVNCLPLRRKMIKLQQEFGKDGNIVCDARDAGTHIFPNAELKVFMVCNIETRVQRRIKQLELQGLEADKDKISKETTLRDQTDYLGPNAVNKKAEDAKELDTSNLSIDEQIGIVVEWAKEIESRK